VTVVVVASDGGRPSTVADHRQWQTIDGGRPSTVASNDGERIDGDQQWLRFVQIF